MRQEYSQPMRSPKVGKSLMCFKKKDQCGCVVSRRKSGKRIGWRDQQELHQNVASHDRVLFYMGDGESGLYSMHINEVIVAVVGEKKKIKMRPQQKQERETRRLFHGLRKR